LLSPFVRALAYYLGGGFALALLCALWFFDRPVDLDERWARRLRRRARILIPLGLLHPVVAVTALGLARDAWRDGDPESSRSTVVVASGSLAASLVVTGAVLVLAG
jgi:hypothetical protein